MFLASFHDAPVTPLVRCVQWHPSPIDAHPFLKAWSARRDVAVGTPLEAAARGCLRKAALWWHEPCANLSAGQPSWPLSLGRDEARLEAASVTQVSLQSKLERTRQEKKDNDLQLHRTAVQDELPQSWKESRQTAGTSARNLRWKQAASQLPFPFPSCHGCPLFRIRIKVECQCALAVRTIDYDSRAREPTSARAKGRSQRGH